MCHYWSRVMIRFWCIYTFNAPDFNAFTLFFTWAHDKYMPLSEYIYFFFFFFSKGNETNQHQIENQKIHAETRGEQAKQSYCSIALRFPSCVRVFTHITNGYSHETWVFFKSCQYGFLQETQNVANKGSCPSVYMPVRTLSHYKPSKETGCKLKVPWSSQGFQQAFLLMWKDLCLHHHVMSFTLFSFTLHYTS